MTAVKTTCAYCGVGCGIIATTKPDGAIQIEGDQDHPANFGRLCSKGLALGDTLAPESRLKHAVVDGVEVDMKTATNAVASRLQETIKKYGPDAVAFYVSGQLLTEDYYVANKLMKGFIGSANIDTNSRLCMASTVAGHKRAFGADVVPGTYEDLEQADLVVLVGSNLAWCHPVLFQRLRAAQETRGTKVVVIDPRRTDTCDIADIHISIMPDGDVLLFNGLLVHLYDKGIAPSPYTDDNVSGFDDALTAAQADLSALTHAVSERGITHEVQQFYDLFSKTEKVVTVFSQGVNQAHNGTDRVNAITNCHLATGRIGQPGMGPFSVTGQPNAMGGREVGGLANMLAAHMGFSQAERKLVEEFWNAPNLAASEGLRAVDMFDAVHDGRIKAIWIMATNPSVSMPNAGKVREALSRCPTVIVSDCVAETDTQAFAYIRLPAAGWGEKDGTVTNSDRTISRQRAFLPTFADARPDWWIICEVASAMGWRHGFSYGSPADIFREHAALSAKENNGIRAFDIGRYESLSQAEYDTLLPSKWPTSKDSKTPIRLFADGDFFTQDRKARMLSIRHLAYPEAPQAKRPLMLNTGRYRDQWHTMTRTGLAAQLNGHRPEPLLDVSHEDALINELKNKDFVRVKTELGSYLARVKVSDAQRTGEVFLPMHWSGTHAGLAVAGTLLAAHVDPVSSQPAFKTGWASIEAVTLPWHAMVFARARIQPKGVDYWSALQLGHCWQYRLAASDQESLKKAIETLQVGLSGDTLQFTDDSANTLRGCVLQDEQPVLAFYLGKNLSGLSPDWVNTVFGLDSISDTDRMCLLAGRPKGATTDPGPIVCACYQVGLNQIEAAISTGGITTIDALASSTCAGTGCGSCIPELKQLLQQERIIHAA
jgi:assimilatory nitrate reductase catalytic subunit